MRGVLPYFIETEATLNASDNGHYAARVALSHDVRLTQKLILQPQVDGVRFNVVGSTLTPPR